MVKGIPTLITPEKGQLTEGKISREETWAKKETKEVRESTSFVFSYQNRDAMRLTRKQKEQKRVTIAGIVFFFILTVYSFARSNQVGLQAGEFSGFSNLYVTSGQIGPVVDGLGWSNRNVHVPVPVQKNIDLKNTFAIYFDGGLSGSFYSEYYNKIYCREQISGNCRD